MSYPDPDEKFNANSIHRGKYVHVTRVQQSGASPREMKFCGGVLLRIYMSLKKINIYLLKTSLN